MAERLLICALCSYSVQDDLLGPSLAATEGRSPPLGSDRQKWPEVCSAPTPQYVLFTGVRGETVWKIAEGGSIVFVRALKTAK